LLAEHFGFTRDLLATLNRYNLKIDRCGRDDLPQRFPLRTGRFTAAQVTIYRRGGEDLPQRFPLRKKRFTAALPMGCGAAHRQLLSRQVP